jgi:uncharacterized membrane protein YfcA|tara:strand:- start:1001 stop:1132 length:132 start_codon:yes stop_codon:yes gene_type:complete
LKIAEILLNIFLILALGFLTGVLSGMFGIGNDWGVYSYGYYFL